MSHGGVYKKGSLNLTKLVENVKGTDGFSRVGAICVFIGLVRGKVENGKSVEKLELEAYEDQANSVLEGICSELSQARGIADVQIHHLLGEFESGEELVYVLAAGEHRDDVFPVFKEAVERFKKEAPVFKKEYVKNEDGKSVSYWVGEKRKQ